MRFKRLLQPTNKIHIFGFGNRIGHYSAGENRTSRIILAREEYTLTQTATLLLVEPLAITAVNRDRVTGEMPITWSSNPGQIYLIESSLDLAVWLEVDDRVPGFPNPSPQPISVLGLPRSGRLQKRARYVMASGDRSHFDLNS